MMRKRLLLKHIVRCLPLVDLPSYPLIWSSDLPTKYKLVGTIFVVCCKFMVIVIDYDGDLRRRKKARASVISEADHSVNNPVNN